MQFSLTLLNPPHSDVLEIGAESNTMGLPVSVGSHTHFDTLLGPDWNSRRVLINMDRAAYIDSASIGWLISSQKSFRANGGELVLHSVQPGVRNVLDLLKIGRVVPIAGDAGAGRALLQDRTAAVHV